MLTDFLHYLAFWFFWHSWHFSQPCGMSDRPASSQSGTGIKGPSPVPECSGIEQDDGCRYTDAGGICFDADVQLCT
jgi:hypothetical protein